MLPVAERWQQLLRCRPGRLQLRFYQMIVPAAPVLYSGALERPKKYDQQTSDALRTALTAIMETTQRDYGHTVRSVHVESHASLRGTGFRLNIESVGLNRFAHRLLMRAQGRSGAFPAKRRDPWDRQSFRTCFPQTKRGRPRGSPTPPSQPYLANRSARHG